MIPPVLIFIAYQVLSHTSLHLALTHLCGKYSHYSHFIGEEIEAQMIFFPKFLSQTVAPTPFKRIPFRNQLFLLWA